MRKLLEMDPKTKKFLVAIADEAKRVQVTELLQKLSAPALVIQAKDGHEADVKLSNALPNFVFIEANIAKVTGYKITEWLLASKKDDKVAVILISEIPDKEHFVEEVVSNRVQFIDDPTNEVKLIDVLHRGNDFINGVVQSDVKIKKVKLGDVIINQGEKGEAVYIVVKGKLVAYHSKDGKDTELGQIGSGEFVGEMAFINGEPRSANVKALEDCELIEIPNNLMNQILFKKPQWMKALMKTLSLRVKSANLSKD